MRPPPQRFALEPLARAVGVRLLSPIEPTGNQHMPEQAVGVRELSRRINVPHRTLVRWRSEGIPAIGRHLGRVVDLPDTLAILYAGTHPALLWPQWLRSSPLEDDALVSTPPSSHEGTDPLAVLRGMRAQGHTAREVADLAAVVWPETARDTREVA